LSTGSGAADARTYPGCRIYATSDDSA
jgi:hypothetical protein